MSTSKSANNLSIRIPSMSCLLCMVKNAEKKNSHILPKFMTKTMLGEGNAKKGFLIDSSQGHRPPEYTQDTPKEDYILCESCEQYFGIIETYIATRLHNRIRNKRFDSQFKTIQYDDEIKVKYSMEINAVIFRLFIYSILWRCHISTTKLCQSFRLADDESESLRSILYSFKQVRQDELLKFIDSGNNSISNFPFALVTAESFNDRTRNALFVSPENINPYFLMINDYMLFFYFANNFKANSLKVFNNYESKTIKIGFFSNHIWETYRRSMVHKIAERTREKLKKEGRGSLDFNQGQ